MLIYKISRDESIKFEELETGFKTNLFASNPALFNEIFSDDGSIADDGFEIEEFAPESEADVTKMLAQLKREGVIK